MLTATHESSFVAQHRSWGRDNFTLDSIKNTKWPFTLQRYGQPKYLLTQPGSVYDDVARQYMYREEDNWSVCCILPQWLLACRVIVLRCPEAYPGFSEGGAEIRHTS